MSTRQQGNVTENRVMAYLESLGYWCTASRGSRGIDIVALATDEMRLPHLGLEAGTESKSVRQAFKKLRDPEVPKYPGMVHLVVRKLKRKNRIVLRWHATDGVHGHDRFHDAIDAARGLA